MTIIPYKEHYLERTLPTKRPQTFYIRPMIVSKYRGFLTDNRNLFLIEQIFQVMQSCRDNDEYITKGEFIAILRRKLSTENPDRYELKRFTDLLFGFRKWVGTVAPMILYGRYKHLEEKDFKGNEWIYQPIKNKTEYKKIRQHIDNVSEGLEKRQKDNLQILEMTQHQIDMRINQLATQLRQKAEHRRRLRKK